MNIKVEIINNTQNIIIEKDGIQKTIYTLENGSNRHFCGYVLDKNYIIIYHDRKDQEGYHYKDVRFVYDINKDDEVELAQGTYSKITNMYVKSKTFNIHTIMSYLLNNFSFNNETKYFHDYMTSYNPSITKEEVKKEVIRQYPLIEKYLNPMIYIFNKKRIEIDFKGGFIPLFAIKQDIKELDRLERVKKQNFDKKLIYNK